MVSSAPSVGIEFSPRYSPGRNTFLALAVTKIDANSRHAVQRFFVADPGPTLTWWGDPPLSDRRRAEVDLVKDAFEFRAGSGQIGFRTFHVVQREEEGPVVEPLLLAYVA